MFYARRLLNIGKSKSHYWNTLDNGINPSRAPRGGAYLLSQCTA